MAENTKIEWATHTFNPWRGCSKVSPGCARCYAEKHESRFGRVKFGPNGTRVITSDANWRKPVAWDREAKESGIRKQVFCASLADVFEDWQGPILGNRGHELRYCGDGCAGGKHRFLPVEEARDVDAFHRRANMDHVRLALFDLIDATPNLDWLLLTKRIENVFEMWPRDERGRLRHLPNIWLGTSTENQLWADKRLPYLHEAKRRNIVEITFVSAEPLLGPIMLQGERDGTVYSHLGEGGIGWVITGGESGPEARPSHPDWFRAIRDQCEASGTAFHFKQHGEWVDEYHEAVGHTEGKCERSDEFVRLIRQPTGEVVDYEGRYMYRVGKKAAGRELDGRTHDGFPRMAVLF